MNKYSTYFVDDNIRFLENLTKNRPASLFDDPYLKFHKELHEKYGLKVQFNLFYENIDKTFNLSQMTDAYKEEFQANKDWLMLGFHARHECPDYPYINATYEEVWCDYSLIEKEIIRFAGKEVITQSLITHWVVMTKEGVQALVDKGAKMMSCTTGDLLEYPEIRSVFSTDHNFRFEMNKRLNVSRAGICRRDTCGLIGAPSMCNYNHLDNKMADEYLGKIKMYKDPETGMIYNRFAGITMNAIRLADFPERFKAIMDQEHVCFLMHEQYFYDDYFAYEPDFADKVEWAIKTTLENGYKHIRLQDLIDLQ